MTQLNLTPKSAQFDDASNVISFNGSNLMNEQVARQEICRVGRSLYERGYVHATAGNISVRIADGYLITPTDACLGFLQADRLAKLDLSAKQISGDKASKTIVLHHSIYEQTSGSKAPAACIIHTHSTHLVACSLRQAKLLKETAFAPDLLPPLTPYFVMKVGHVPHISYHRPGSSLASQEVVNAIKLHEQQGNNIRAVMLAKLGPTVWHETPAQAMALLEELEETARLYSMNPDCESLSPTEIQDLCDHFHLSW